MEFPLLTSSRTPPIREEQMAYSSLPASGSQVAGPFESQCALNATPATSLTMRRQHGQPPQNDVQFHPGTTLFQPYLHSGQDENTSVTDTVLYFSLMHCVLVALRYYPTKPYWQVKTQGGSPALTV